MEIPFLSFIGKQYIKIIPQEVFIGVVGNFSKTIILTLQHILSKKYSVITTKPGIKLWAIRPKKGRIILDLNQKKDHMDNSWENITPNVIIVSSLTLAGKKIISEINRISSTLSNDGLVILNYDDLAVRKLADNSKARVIYFGQDSENCQVWLSNLKIEDFNSSFEINYGVERVKIKLPILGEHHIYSILAASALALNEGISLIAIKNYLEKIPQQENELQVLPGFNGAVVLDDLGEGTYLSVEGAIDTLQQLSVRRRILCFGEMKDDNIDTEILHRKIAQKIYREKVDLVFLGVGAANIIADELKRLGFLTEKMEANLQNPQMVSKLLKVLVKGDVCLVKGAKSVRLDEVVKRIIKKI